MVQLRCSGRSIAVTVLIAVSLLIAVGQRPALAAAPVAIDDTYSTPANTTLTVAAPGVLANDSDPDGDPLTAGMPRAPQQGTLRLNMDGSFTYTPNAGFTGTDNFSYMAHDPNGGMTTATVTISVGSGATLPTFRVSDRTVTEGNAGVTTNAVFTIARTGSTAGVSTVKFFTANGTATAGSDYTAVAPTVVTFPAGVASKNVIVKVLGDNVDEPNETFFVKLSAPTGATIADGTGVGYILDNDGGPVSAFTINNVAVTEGNLGTSINAVLTVTRSGSTATAASVRYTTAPNTATGGSDYTTVPSTVLTFAAGVASRTVPVKVLGDNIDEPNETFFVKLSSPSGAVISDALGVVTIVDND